MRRGNTYRKILILVICTSILLSAGVSAQAAYSVSFKSSGIEITSPKSSGQSFDGSLCM
ncbi:MAG: hypothetical protein QME73_02760 [Bacillota bacterium]|nr:hypothetical protein [Bacillota bacterium]